MEDKKINKKKRYVLTNMKKTNSVKFFPHTYMHSELNMNLDGVLILHISSYIIL